jgi:hypothetical protein
MPEKYKKLEISRLYLDLASECFNKAESAEHAQAAEAFIGMGRRYIAQAAAFKASISIGNAATSAA